MLFLIKLEAANAQSISKAILNELNTLSFNLNKIVCQSYDGAASSCFVWLYRRSAKTYIREFEPKYSLYSLF